MIKSIFISILFVALFASCSFNKIFLKPSVIPITAKRATVKLINDTTVFSFTGDKHQPNIIQKNGKPVNVDYSIESVIFTNSIGNKLNGWLLKSKNIIPNITLLQLHGNEGSILSQYQALKPLLKNGFQIFVFDYSGFGFSEGKATRENILIDAIAAVDYVKSRNDVKNTKLVIYGQSIGGHLAATVAVEEQQKVDGLVIEGAFSSYKEIAGKKIPILGRIFTKRGYSAIKSIKDFHKPLLVIHSTEDKEVPFNMGKKIFDNANYPKEFLEIKNCHICGPKFYADEISAKIKNMFSEK